MKKNKNIIVTFLILFISIGFAYLSTTLNIGGSVTFKENNFDIHFENIEVISEDVSYSTLEISNTTPTTINASINFKEPSEIFEYIVDVVNGGGIDALFQSIDNNLNASNQDYITIEIKYFDGTEINENDVLRMGQSKRIRVKVIYNYDIEKLPTMETTSITTTINYINANVRDVTYDRKVWNYDYTGYEQIFIVPKTGTYKIELWGAEGGKRIGSDVTDSGGKGGYTSGTINLEKNEKLYFYIGQKGIHYNYNNGTKIYNGGGICNFVGNKGSGGSGGGSTDVRIMSSEWDDFNSLKTRIMVAAGGGGTGYLGTSGGAGGGLIGIDAIPSTSFLEYSYGHGGKQTSGGLWNVTTSGIFPGGFGYGGNSLGAWDGGGAGGSGYFGGSGGRVNAGGGGSSYISGHIGCIAIEATTTEDNIIFPDKNNAQCTDGTIDIECSNHYLNKIFTDTIMIDGTGKEWKYHNGDTEVTASSEIVGMPTHDDTGTMTGNTGNGYARITLIS